MPPLQHRLDPTLGGWATLYVSVDFLPRHLARAHNTTPTFAERNRGQLRVPHHFAGCAKSAPPAAGIGAQTRRVDSTPDIVNEIGLGFDLKRDGVFARFSGDSAFRGKQEIRVPAHRQALCLSLPNQHC